jgi:hypothetical protein
MKPLSAPDNRIGNKSKREGSKSWTNEEARPNSLGMDLILLELK